MGKFTIFFGGAVEAAMLAVDAARFGAQLGRLGVEAYMKFFECKIFIPMLSFCSQATITSWTFSSGFKGINGSLTLRLNTCVAKSFNGSFQTF